MIDVSKNKLEITSLTELLHNQIKTLLADFLEEYGVFGFVWILFSNSGWHTCCLSCLENKKYNTEYLTKVKIPSVYFIISCTYCLYVNEYSLTMFEMEQYINYFCEVGEPTTLADKFQLLRIFNFHSLIGEKNLKRMFKKFHPDFPIEFII